MRRAILPLSLLALLCGATTAPAAVNSRSRLTTMVVRPLSGLPIERKVLRPMMTGLPMVSARKCCMSDRSRHGSAFPLPMTPFSATAAMRRMLGKVQIVAKPRCGPYAARAQRRGQ